MSTSQLNTQTASPGQLFNTTFNRFHDFPPPGAVISGGPGQKLLEFYEVDAFPANDRRILPVHKRRPVVPDPEPGGSADFRHSGPAGSTGPFSCPRCGETVKWAKINFTRPDGAFDWRLDVWCPECGEIRDPEILAAIRDIHLEEVIRGIHRIQDEAIEPHLDHFLTCLLAELRQSEGACERAEPCPRQSVKNAGTSGTTGTPEERG